MSDRQPNVSVILPVYNGQEFILESIQSILNQTYKNLELIIIDDGSIDNTYQIISSQTDPRITIIRQENIGLAKSLNKGIRLSKSSLIARQDADDLSHPERIEKQVRYMNENITCDLLGTWAKVLEEKNSSFSYLIHPTTSIGCKISLLFDCCFTHSSVMIRRTILDKVGLYSEDSNRQPPEDYDLWSRIAIHSEVSNLPEVLVQYRKRNTSMSYGKPLELRKNAVKISKDNISFWSDSIIDFKAALTIAEIYHSLPDVTYRDFSFTRLASVLKRAFKSISEGELSDNLLKELNYRIFKLKIKWILNHSILHKVGFIFISFLKFLKYVFFKFKFLSDFHFLLISKKNIKF